MFTPSDATNNELDELHVDPKAELENYTRKNANVKYLHTRHGENAASTLADSCHSGDGKENKMI